MRRDGWIEMDCLLEMSYWTPTTRVLIIVQLWYVSMLGYQSVVFGLGELR